MRFTWDVKKNRTNLRDHGLDFVDAWQVFRAPMLTKLDTREDYGEDRWIGLGVLDTRVVVIVFTERGEDIIRIISLRKATIYERLQYEKTISKRLGAR